MQLKRVRITAREVHDGLGGRYFMGEAPTLPADIAVIIVSRNMAVYEEDVEPPEESGSLASEASEIPARKKRERRK